jgi:hypothetical protein
MSDEQDEGQDAHVFVESDEDVESESALRPSQATGQDRLQGQDDEAHQGEVLSQLPEKAIAQARTPYGDQENGDDDQENIEEDEEEWLTHRWVSRFELLWYLSRGETVIREL